MRYTNRCLPLPLPLVIVVSAVLDLSCKQTDRQTDRQTDTHTKADDRYTHATPVGVSNES